MNTPLLISVKIHHQKKAMRGRKHVKVDDIKVIKKELHDRVLGKQKKEKKK